MLMKLRTDPKISESEVKLVYHKYLYKII